MSHLYIVREIYIARLKTRESKYRKRKLFKTLNNKIFILNNNFWNKKLRYIILTYVFIALSKMFYIPYDVLYIGILFD